MLDGGTLFAEREPIALIASQETFTSLVIAP
jgi:hypothetical protein